MGVVANHLVDLSSLKLHAVDLSNEATDSEAKVFTCFELQLRWNQGSVVASWNSSNSAVLLDDRL